MDSSPGSRGDAEGGEEEDEFTRRLLAARSRWERSRELAVLFWEEEDVVSVVRGAKIIGVSNAEQVESQSKPSGDGCQGKKFAILFPPQIVQFSCNINILLCVTRNSLIV